MDKKVRILLTTPLFGSFQTKEPMPPLGLMYIAGVLEQKGYTVRILDNYLEKNNVEDFIKIIDAFEPSMIGITCNVEDRFEAFKLSNIIKDVSENIIVVLGGPFPSVCHKEIIEDIKSVDIVVRGEGEYTLLDIAGSIEKGEHFDDITGITYRAKGGIKINKSRTFIQNLDELPFPAFHLLKIKEYPNYMKGYKNKFLDKTNTDVAYTASLIFGRGCPYNCLFCSSKELWHRSFRILSPENAVRQIEYFINKGINAFAFWDDHLLLNRKWFNDFAEQIKKRKLKFIFKCLARVDSIDEKVAQELKEIGCKMITLGIENGSQYVLDLMNKGTDVAQIENAIKLLYENKILITGGSILNTPGETFENISENLKFFRKLEQNYGKETSIPINMIIYPGTDLEKVAIEKGYLRNFKWTKDYFEKRNLLLNHRPYTPLYENIPIEKLVEYIILGSLKTRYYTLLAVIILNQIVKGNINSKLVDKHFKRNFYISKILEIILKAPFEKKINWINMLLFKVLFKVMLPKVKRKLIKTIKKYLDKYTD